PCRVTPPRRRGSARTRAADPQRAGASQPVEPLTERSKTVSKRSVTVAAVDVEALEREAQGAVAAASTPAALDEARIRYLGRKSELNQALRAVRERETGMTLNAARERLEPAFDPRAAAP